MEPTTNTWTLQKNPTKWVQCDDEREEPAPSEIVLEWQQQAVNTQRAVSGKSPTVSTNIAHANAPFPTQQSTSLGNFFFNVAGAVRRGFHNFIHLSLEELDESISRHRSSYDQVQKLGSPIDRLTASESIKEDMQELLQRATANENFTEKEKQPAIDLLTEVQGFHQSAIEDCYHGWKESIETSLTAAEEQNSVFSKEELTALTKWHGNLKALCEKYHDHLPEDATKLASQIGQQVGSVKEIARRADEPLNKEQLIEAQNTLISLQDEYNNLLAIKYLTPQELCTMLHEIKNRTDPLDLSFVTRKTDANAQRFVTQWQAFQTTLNTKISSLPQPPESWLSKDS